LLKVMLLLKRHPSLSMAEFRERYESIHVPAVLKNATKLRGYERHYLHPGRHVIFGDTVAEPEYDVLTELWYDDMAALKAAAASSQMKAVTDNGALHLGAIKSFITEEVAIIP